MRQRFREIRDDPKIGKREKGKQLKLFRFANLAACSEGPARLRELIGEEKYDRLLRMKLRRR